MDMATPITTTKAMATGTENTAGANTSGATANAVTGTIDVTGMATVMAGTPMAITAVMDTGMGMDTVVSGIRTAVFISG